MKRLQLVFIPAPGLLGHLRPAVEFAKLLIDQNDHLSVKFLIMELPSDGLGDNHIHSLSSPSVSKRIDFIRLPKLDHALESNSSRFLYLLVESHKQHVKDVISKLIESDSTRLAGIVVDFFCMTMIDVAKQFNIPSYAFLTFSAGFVGLMLHCVSLLDNQDRDFMSVLEGSEKEVIVPCFANPVPANVLPPVAFDKEFGLCMARRFMETKSIILNTFKELEPYALNSLANEAYPPIYSIGPILKLEGNAGSSSEKQNNQSCDTIRWLDQHPPSSVVYLCFGSIGSFDKDQIKEIAYGLESTSFRFIWSLRLHSSKDTNLEQVLPDGFLERTSKIGLVVVGWSPQAAILAHQAIGGFVSHCGWNSTLESLWHGVPIATWPIFAEQQLNAFEMVRELGLAVEIKLDYQRDYDRSRVEKVSAEEIERGLRLLMEENSGVRRKVKMMKEQGRKAVIEGGSSYTLLHQLIKDMKIHTEHTIQ